MNHTWKRLAASGVNLRFTLANGQCFGWVAVDGGEDIWAGVLGSYVTLLKQTPCGGVDYRCINRFDSPSDYAQSFHEAWLRDYFQLDVEFDAQYERWMQYDDARSRAIFTALHGMRPLRQFPFECLMSFICSSNNHISRIAQMLQRLRSAYGKPIETRFPVESGGTLQTFYGFPSLGDLEQATETELRELGFGYRAKFIVKSVEQLQGKTGGGELWLSLLRKEKDPKVVQDALVTLPGVGQKVADCVALFSLDQVGCIPVDTHVLEIACREYDPKLKQVKSVTPKVYQAIGDIFRNAYGTHAGWAHQMLFASELPQFQEFLPKEFRTPVKAKKTAKKQRKSTKSDGTAGAAKKRVKANSNNASSAAPTKKQIKAEDNNAGSTAATKKLVDTESNNNAGSAAATKKRAKTEQPHTTDDNTTPETVPIPPTRRSARIRKATSTKE